MADRAIFLDRDNTIIDNDGYLGDPSKVKLLPGAGTALTSLRALGYRLIVVSNQSGVARGMFREADVEAVNDEMSRQLREQAGAYVDASYYCPFHPEAAVAEYRVDHDWRKPKPGMLLQAAADFGLELSSCWMIGDQWRDVAAGAAAGCRTILLKDPERKRGGEDEKMEAVISPGFVVKSLTDAARIIVREGRHGPAPVPAPPAPEEPAGPAVVPATPALPALTIPAAPVAAAVPASVAPAALDEVALAQRLAETLAKHFPAPAPAAPAVSAVVAPAPPAASGAASVMASAGLEKQLDELVVQLRQQNRNAALRPDFSMSHITMFIAQAFALAAVVIGLVKYFTMKVSFAGAQEVQFALMSHLQALIWIVAGVFLQGVVVALLVYGRNK